MELILQSGRRISLSRIEQWRTYQGLLCGKLSPEQNEEKLQALLERAGDQCGNGAAILVRPPTVALLPAISCIAIFDSGPLAWLDSEPYSSLAVAWLQEAYALPIDERVIAHIQQVAWDALAVDWCW